MTRDAAQNNPLARAIAIVGLSRLARGLDVTHQAVRKWEKAGRLPRTEWTGETDYSARIAEMTEHRVTRDELLAKWPAGEPAPAAQPLARAA